MTTKIKSDDLYAIENPIGLQLPRGTTGQRPADARTGTVRFNITTGEVELRRGLSGTWFNLLRTSDTVSSINAGPTVDRPAAGHDGSVWIDLTEKKIYFDNGTAWISISASDTVDPVAVLQGDLGGLNMADATDAFGATVTSDALDLGANGNMYEIDLGGIA